MKRNLILCFCCVFSLILFLTAFGCEKDKSLQMNKDYYYSGIGFEKSQDLKIEDLAIFIPMGYSIDSVSGFEKMIRENIDTYSLDIMCEGGRVRVYLKNEIDAICVTENEIVLTLDEEKKEFSYQRNGDVFVLDNAKEVLMHDIEFCSGELRYKIRFNDKFAVVHRFTL